MRPFARYEVGKLYGLRSMQSEVDVFMNRVQHFQHHDEEDLMSDDVDQKMGIDNIRMFGDDGRVLVFKRTLLVVAAWELTGFESPPKPPPAQPIDESDD